MRSITFLLCVLLGSTLSQKGRDNSVCTIPTPLPNQKAFPDLPEMYSTRIQVNILKNSSTLDIMEIVDTPNQRAVIIDTAATGAYKNITLSTKTIFDFRMNQMMEIIPNPATGLSCEAFVLDKTDGRFVFGDNAGSTSGFSVRSTFRVPDDSPPAYLGKVTLDNGQTAEAWTSCVYQKHGDMTANFTWYFSAEDWVTSLGAKLIPVRIEITGKAYNDQQQPRDEKMIAVFTGFRDYIVDWEVSQFQIPEGTLCTFMKDADVNKSLPTVASGATFSFTAEVLQADNVISVIREFFDKTVNLTRYDYRPQSIGMIESPWGDNQVKEIHDFSTGHSYVVDTILGNCTIQPIKGDSFDSEWTDQSHVRMRSVAEFFGMTKTDMNWTYTGQRDIRGIIADMYIAERNGWPSSLPARTESTWEIAFAADTYIQSTGAVYQQREPIRLWINVPEYSFKVVYNIYNFDEEEPDIWYFDVGECFDNSQKRLVTFNLPTEAKVAWKADPKQFRYNIYLALALYSAVRPIRISRMELDDDGDELIVRFHLLNAPNFAGSVVNTGYTPSSDEIITQLRDNIDGGVFEVFTDLQKGATLVAVKNSFKTAVVTSETKTILQLTAGTSAAIVICCLIVGIALGFVVIIIVSKVRKTDVPGLSLAFLPKIFHSS